MSSPALIVATAREYLGTPYLHQGRVKGLGVDCLGLLICVGRELEFLPASFDKQDYTTQPDPVEFLAGLEREMWAIEIHEARPGDVLLLASHGVATHVAFKTDRGILHAYAPAGRVVEHGLRAQFATAVRRAFRARRSN